MAAGVAYYTMFGWLTEGKRKTAKSLYRNFRKSVLEARETFQNARPKAMPRTLRRNVSERHISESELTVMAHAEIMRVFDEGRVPDAIAAQVLDMAYADIQERRAQNSLSYEDWHDN